jgi:hypothetical protein
LLAPSNRSRTVLRAALALAAAGLLTVLLARPTGQAPAQAGSPGSALLGAIDLPAADGVSSGPTYVQGWAIDASGSDGIGVDRVSIYLDGVFVKDAHTRLVRDDIASAYGARFRLSGWQALLDLDAFTTAGKHQLQARVYGTLSGAEVVIFRDIAVTARRRFGVSAHLLWFDPASAANDLDRIRANGLDTVRFDVAWDAFEPAVQGELDMAYLAKLDDALDLAAARGAHVILVVVGTPAWARANTGSRMTPPTNPVTFGVALHALASRYAQRSDMVYEIWNEPNQSEFWDTPTGPDPASYTRLLAAAYGAIKKAAPSATVLGGSVVFNEPDYIEGMYAAGAAGQFDGLALHPYSGADGPDSTSNPPRSFVLALDQARTILTTHGDGHKAIWITEMGWSTREVSDVTRAEYYRRAVELVRARPDIAAFCAYGLNQSDDYPDAGLIGAAGVPTASWSAYGLAVGGR